MGTLVKENDELVYSFFNVDQIFDFLLSINMRPFVELSFMPTAIASKGDSVFHYRGNITPPTHDRDWNALIDTLVRHWVERYGIAEVRQWFFEVWNEPNLPAFWTGTQADYFHLYQLTARAIKAIDGALVVGGPATASNEWIPEFSKFCHKNRVPLDFISTHHYPTDAFGKPGDDTVEQLAKSHRSVLREEAQRVHDQAGTTPVYYTEWCTSSNPFDDLHDQPYAAAFIIKSALDVCQLVRAYSYWTFSDIFEENYFSSKAFHGGFGLITIDGIAKPAYRAFQFLHRLGDQIYAVDGSHPTVDVWVTSKEDVVSILVTNGALPKHPITDELVTIALDGVALVSSAIIERIDDDNANARAVWIEMGQPERPTPRQRQALEAASLCRPELQAVTVQHGTATLTLMMPPQGTALVTLRFSPA